VEVVEMLGAERLVHGRLGNAAFTLRIDGTLSAPKPGQVLPLQPLRQRLHWFDPADGRRIG
jgi:sn-glycerol 3-phosphate transport system ATP-binding protein